MSLSVDRDRIKAPASVSTRSRAIFILVLLAIAAFAGYLLWPAMPGDPQCRKQGLRDANGAVVMGVEDLAVDRARERLIVSAYDRRKNTPGGLYLLPLAALQDDAGALAGTMLGDKSEELRPHGIALAPLADGTANLHLINRIKSVDGRTAELLTYRLKGEDTILLRRLDVPCGANDVIETKEGQILMTIDRKYCGGFKRVLGDAQGRREGRVVAVEPDGTLRPLIENIAFANGIAADDTTLYVAATREDALLLFDRKTLGTHAPPRIVKLPGAPDNLAWGEDGRLLIAVHRSLLRFAAFRLGLRTDSPGLILAYDTQRNADGAQTLYNLGTAIDGPTGAAESNGVLVVGGAFGEDLAICRGKGG